MEETTSSTDKREKMIKETMKWHIILNHVNFDTMKKMIQNQSTIGISLREVIPSAFHGCLFGKMTLKPFCWNKQSWEFVRRWQREREIRVHTKHKGFISTPKSSHVYSGHPGSFQKEVKDTHNYKKGTENLSEVWSLQVVWDVFSNSVPTRK
jgi:hypothetical protein